LIQNPNKPFLALLPDFVFQFLLGGMAGILIGKLTLFLINRLKLGYEGLYPVLALGMALMVYAVSNRLGGSGFLSVYIFGLWLGKEDFLHKKSLIRFYDGLAWLMQIIMFVTLGLLVFPSRVFPIILPGLLLAFGLIFIARPISVFLILPLFKRYRFRETMLVSWIGLRGAVPIILATFPLQYKLDGADLIFNIIFFVVLVSVLFQGTSIPYLVKLLRLEELMTPPDVSPIEISPGVILGRRFEEVAISPDSSAIKKAIYELQLPDEFLIILINRKGEYIIPSGSVILEPEDRILALSESNAFDQALDILEAKVTER
jgi:cell volume regulation protein A